MKETIDFINSFLNKNDVVVLGCSYGPDSMALLDVLIKIREILEITIVCAHVNHNLRKESYTEMSYLEQYCKKYDVMYESMIIEKYGDDNFHNEARVIRYNFFEELINKYEAKYLMTAHHGDDLVETILMRIVRGSTASGYSGFSSIIDKGNYKILRPLIFTTKDMILDYNKRNKVPYAIDKSNFKTKYTRNRYRKSVLPFLKKEDKNVHKKFLEYSNKLLMADNYINQQVSKYVGKVYINNELDIIEFKKLDNIIGERIIYLMLEEFYLDDLVLISDVHVKLINDLILSNKANTYIYLPNNIKMIKTYNKIFIKKETELIDSYEIELVDYAHLPNNKNISLVLEQDRNNNNYCRLNSCDIVLPLIVRTRKSGDKMIIKNMSGSRKIKDIFIDAKIPINERDLWPIVTDSKDNIVWIPGLKKSKHDVSKSDKCDIILKYY